MLDDPQNLPSGSLIESPNEDRILPKVPKNAGNTEWAVHGNNLSELNEDCYAIHDISHINAFVKTIDGVEKLLAIDVGASEQKCFRRLLYVQVIIALEAYLSDTFITSIKNNPALLRRFVEGEPEFKKESFTLNEVFSAREAIEKKVRKHLSEMGWHRLGKVKRMFQNTLGIDFPSDLSLIGKAIKTRHDIVHRNGTSADGSEHDLSVRDVQNLISSVREVVLTIEEQTQKTLLSNIATAQLFEA